MSHAVSQQGLADEAMTRRALELAEMGIGRVSPSPLVGCVITSSSGEVVGEGTYIYKEVTHAEVIALKRAGSKATGGTAYVSLEPHSHHGRTPPCTEALINAGIVRVVCPIEDPNPLVSGSGFETLRTHGIEVVTGILKEAAARQNEKFICWHKNGRPFIHLKSAVTLDGKTATPAGESQWITSDEAREDGQRLRHEYDAILVGSGTALADDPSLTDRTGKERNRPLVRIVLDSSLRIDPGSVLVRTSHETPLLIYSGPEARGREGRLKGTGAEVVVLDGGPGDLGAVLADLHSRQITSVLVEGGATVAGSFLAQRLVDKVTYYVAPKLVGGASSPTSIGGEGFAKLTEALGLKDVSISFCGPDIRIDAYTQQAS